ncbi:hypothetical protein C8N35_102129 [Breoghania corrubedonensis]|uniref:Uncharacterized protein n=1 Tax=Breoghania corrubedonensis TaxID=665038 RepID=A0A2T5VCE0_9HYPH|nr:hypothetical protein [Breoghania corrubedonensis]PTW61420.1 hypothetical protein C8N35_102129 [Breoghania corrubedonensis]
MKPETTTRDDLIERLARVVPSRKARATFLRADDATLRRIVERMEASAEETRRIGHIHSTGIGFVKIS